MKEQIYFITARIQSLNMERQYYCFLNFSNPEIINIIILIFHKILKVHMHTQRYLKPSSRSGCVLKLRV